MTFSPLTANPINLPPSSFYYLLIDNCLSLRSLPSANSIHARLLKLGLHRQTFLGNHLLHLYSRLGPLLSVIRVFNDILNKNNFTWNILLAAFANAGRMIDARKVFESMPAKDAVSWNSIISGYVGIGQFNSALESLCTMREVGVRGNVYTLSISASCVFSPLQAKQVHGSAVRFGYVCSNVVVGNSLINMYGRVGLVDYAYAVFSSLNNPDIISWNSMISAFRNSAYLCLAFGCFRSMLACGFLPDEFGISATISVCANTEDIDMGEQLFAICFKTGLLSNSIVCSAVIDMYSKCGRLGDSLRLFGSMETFDSSTFNSMTTAYSRANLVNETLGLFVMAIRREVMPTEFTFASILSSNSSFGLPEQGMQIHCWVHKLGMEVDEIIATSLVDMYMKFGSVECAYKIFSARSSKDLISWNTLIMGLAQNGQEAEGLIKFEELLIRGIEPDRITLLGVLFACCNAGMVCAGKKIFSSMEKEYGIKRGLEHYACIVEMVGRAGRLEEALEIMEAMPYKPNASILQCLLEAGTFYGNLSYVEKVAELMMMLEPQCSSPYLVLARIYERRRMWDSMARIVRTMEKKGLKRVRECSWIGIRNQVFTFSVDDLQHHGGEVMYSALHLLFWEIVNEDYVPGGFEDLRTMSKEDGLV